MGASVASRRGASGHDRAARPQRTHRISRRVVLSVALAVVAIALAGASAASAIVIHISQGRTLSYSAVPGTPAPPSPFDLTFHNLDYNGGPVMSSNTNYTFYWAPGGSSAYPADYQPGLNRFFEDLAHESGTHTNADSVATQYNSANGELANYSSQFAGAIIDTNPYPANGCVYAVICLTDAQIRAELTSYIAAHKLPSDLTHEYFVLTPPGVESCLEGTVCSAGTSHPSYCAYHGAIKPAAGGAIVYADDPYVAGGICDTANHPNGTTADATITGGLSHEHIESLTDPEPNNAWTDWAGGPLGWGYEIGDKCRTFYEPTEYGATLGVAPNGARYNQVINGHYYWYQQEWSNQGHSCLQRFTFKGERPKAAFTYMTNPTNPELATFNGSGSTAPGGVATYEWQLNATSVGSTPLETTLPTLTYEFAKTGLYDVALTVFAADGTSSGTAQTVNISEPPEPKITGVSPKNGAAGSPVSITGSGFRNVTAVKFGAVASASYTVNSETSITATAPPGSGTVDIAVTNTSGTSEPGTADQFKYVPLPSITSITPQSGPEAGGTQVTITGTNLTGASVVRFGAAAAAGYTVNSATSITATAPPGAGTVDVTVTTPEGTSVTGAADRFRYLMIPIVTSISPSSGREAGSTLVTITGVDLTGATAVDFGSVASPSFTVVSATSITAISPAGTGAVNVTVTTPEGVSAASAGSLFTYLGPPAVTAMAPSSGPEAGGTSVSISGREFAGATSVAFGSTPASSFTVNSATSITATSPAGSGAVDVIVTTPQGTSIAAAADRFTYTSAPLVSAVSPAAGPEGGGTVVTITGAAFSGVSAVSFGSQPAAAFTVNSETSITATAPAGSGTVDVIVTSPAGTSAPSSADRFSYAPLPTVTAISPAGGPEGGGTTVTITGTNLTAATAVDFGMTPAPSVTVNSPTSITAAAPAGVGAVDVTVTTPGGTSLTSFADQFSYESPPSISSVSPQGGPAVGGTTVTITGTNLTGTFTVAFGGYGAASFHINSPNSITAVSPAQAAGVVDVWVTNGAGSSGRTAADHFTYTPSATVKKISPTSGSPLGGTSVTITGTNLSGATAVDFGTSPSPSIHVNSATSVTALSPAGTSGVTDVTVITAANGTSAISKTDRFKYTAPSITAVSPSSGPAAGGNTITVTGSGFAPGALLSAFKVGRFYASGVSCSSSTQCTLTAPSGKAGTVDVVATVNKLSSAKGTADRYTFQ